MPVVSASILGGIQAAAGIAQYIKGRQIAKSNVRPTYEIPTEISQNLTQAQMAALEGLPPEQKKQYVENVQRQQNFGLTALGERKSGIAGLAALTQSGSDAYKDLLSADAAARAENQQRLMSAREQMAGYKDKSFELNKLLPYQEKAEAATGLQGAGLQNIMGGLQSAQGSFENTELAKMYNEGQSAGMAGGQKTSEAFGTAPQRTDTLNQYKIARMSNPNLTYQQFLAGQR